jgi:hypothetical protein
MTRTNTELVSNLPQFEAKRSQDFPDWLIVTCPREECPGGNFMVRAKDWLAAFRTRPTDPSKRPTLIEGRVCPYCFRVSKLPLRRHIK